MYHSKSGHRKRAIFLLEQWKKEGTEKKRKEIEEQLALILPAEVGSFRLGTRVYNRTHSSEETKLEFHSRAQLLLYIKSIKPEDYRLP
jgi:hypothetical protein